MLGQRGDGQGWIDTEVGADHRSIDHIETIMTEDLSGGVDDPRVRPGRNGAPAENMRGGRGIQKNLVEGTLRNRIQLLRELSRHLVGEGDV